MLLYLPAKQLETIFMAKGAVFTCYSFHGSMSPRFFNDKITDSWELKCGILFSLDLFRHPAANLSVIYSRE